jgi:hypothetical protein
MGRQGRRVEAVGVTGAAVRNGSQGFSGTPELAAEHRLAEAADVSEGG